MCEAHDECKDRGGKCCNDYCCNKEYFDALQKLACPERDEDCEAAKQTMIDNEKTSLTCTTDELCEGKQSGHTCCEDNPLLKNIALSDPMENWGESKRCCMSSTHLRKLSDVDDKLTTADYVKVDQEVGKLAKDKQEETCDALEEPIAGKIETCKTFAEAKKSKLALKKQEEKAVEDATAAASEVETAAENALVQMKAAEVAKSAAEAAKITAETSEELETIKTANATAHAEAKKAQEAAKKAAEEVKTANTALNTVKTEAAKAGSMTVEADTVVAAATKSAQNAANNATKAKEHAKAAKVAAAAAKTAADKAGQEGRQPKNLEVEDPEITTTKPLPSITPNNSNISAALEPVNEPKEVSSESNPEIPPTDKPVVDTTPKPAPKSNAKIGKQNDPKENNSGNGMTMSTVGFISCLIFYSLINRLEVPASLF